MVTGVALVLSVLGHQYGGGALPDPSALTIVGVLTLLVATVLTRSRVPALRLGVVLCCLQAVSHLVFQHTVGTPPVTLVAGYGGHLHANATHGLGGSWAPHTASLAGSGHFAATHGLTAGMLTAHLLATLVTTWFLSRGEQMLWRAVARMFTVVDRMTIAVTTPTWRPIILHLSHPASREVGLGTSPRGPPPRCAL